ncbi:MAG TPA: ribosome recycling factor [Clostridiales bacterium]|nr:ribosome recycling factor [Clostridiales bacterium]
MLEDLIGKNARARKKADSRKKTAAVAAGVAAGAAIGAAAGVLLAPKAGKQTRKEIAESSKKALSTVKGKLEEAATRVKTAKATKSAEKTEAPATGDAAANTGE